MSENIILQDGNVPATRRMTRLGQKSASARLEALAEWKKRKRQTMAPSAPNKVIEKDENPVQEANPPVKRARSKSISSVFGGKSTAKSAVPARTPLAPKQSIPRRKSTAVTSTTSKSILTTRPKRKSSLFTPTSSSLARSSAANSKAKPKRKSVAGNVSDGNKEAGAGITTKLESENENLKEENAMLHTQLNDQQKHLEKLQEWWAEAQAAKMEEEEEVETHTQGVQVEIRDTSADVFMQKMEVEAEAYAEEIQSLRYSLDRRSHQVESADQSVQQLREASQLLADENMRLSQALEQQKVDQLKQMQQHLGTLQASSKQTCALRETISALNGRVSALSSDNHQDTALIGSLRNSLKEMVGENDALNESLDTVSREKMMVDNALVEVSILQECLRIDAEFASRIVPIPVKVQMQEEKKNPIVVDAGTQFTAVDVQLQRIRIRELQEEVEALRFANEVVIQEIKQQKREFTREIREIREQSAQEEEFETQIAELQEQMEAVLAESMRRVSSLEEELEEERTKNSNKNRPSIASRLRELKS